MFLDLLKAAGDCVSLLFDVPDHVPCWSITRKLLKATVLSRTTGLPNAYLVFTKFLWLFTLTRFLSTILVDCSVWLNDPTKAVNKNNFLVSWFSDKWTHRNARSPFESVTASIPGRSAIRKKGTPLPAFNRCPLRWIGLDVERSLNPISTSLSSNCGQSIVFLTRICSSLSGGRRARGPVR